MKMKSDIQETCLNFIHNFIQTNNFSPTYREIKDGTNIESGNFAYKVVGALMDRGFIFRIPGKRRSIEIVTLDENGLPEKGLVKRLQLGNSFFKNKIIKMSKRIEHLENENRFLNRGIVKKNKKWQAKTENSNRV